MSTHLTHISSLPIQCPAEDLFREILKIAKYHAVLLVVALAGRPSAMPRIKLSQKTLAKEKTNIDQLMQIGKA